MPFPPPTHGFEEQPIAESIEDYLVPKKSTIQSIIAKEDLTLKNIQKGDALTVEVGRNPHDGCVAFVEHEGDVFLVVLHWRNNRWYAQTDTRKGQVPEEMHLIGVVRALIKDQLNEQ